MYVAWGWRAQASIFFKAPLWGNSRPAAPHLQCRRPRFDSWVGKIHWRDGLPTPVFLGFPGGSAGKESARNVGDLGLIPGLGRRPGEGNGWGFWPGESHGVYHPWDLSSAANHRLWVAGGLATSHVPFKQCSERDVMLLLRKVIRGDSQKAIVPLFHVGRYH